ncbi:Zn(2)-C6 fungal-type domain-containing protein [Mycena sanguinolenta]|uniref:Zn(2)-C6 fungal-type domain-containing protein n=1 Tax=Mycena sanguinolenta TaxID=230812 RepID=A0A8H6XCT3_9AGAR|nr:Zn(2)-C6 fungal-type domain-containing protein [Mycena sanguinolenta]
METWKRPRKPPACDPCKVRRVLCHPQPGGAPCPRCLEKGFICTTTAVPRGRPRKHPVQPASGRPHQTTPPLVLHPLPNFASSAPCPELSPEFVAHCFEGLTFNALYQHPLIMATSIRSELHAVSFQINLLPPQSRVLALCSVAFGSLCAFHESVLGDGPRPDSFLDPVFFSSSPDLLSCGVRRAAACQALRSEALKAAWKVGIILLASHENAASCYLLDLMDQTHEIASAGRPWATAYIAHMRSLAVWRTPPEVPWAPSSSGFLWIAYLMCDCLISARSRTPPLVTAQDQLLLCGPEPPLETLLATLEQSMNNPDVSLLWTSTKTYMFHITTIARELVEKITGDVPRDRPLSQIAVLSFLESLSKIYSILTLLLDLVDALTAVPVISPPAVLDGAQIDVLAVTAAFGACFGFSGIVLPFYRELQHRDAEAREGAPTRERLQAHHMAVLAAREMARGIRYVPKIHYSPVHWETIRSWAEWAAEEADLAGGTISPEEARDLETLADELKLLGYSLDAASAPETVALIARMEGHVNRTIASLFLPPDDGSHLNEGAVSLQK